MPRCALRCHIYNGLQCESAFQLTVWRQDIEMLEDKKGRQLTAETLQNRQIRQLGTADADWVTLPHRRVEVAQSLEAWRQPKHRHMTALLWPKRGQECSRRHPALSDAHAPAF